MCPMKHPWPRHIRTCAPQCLRRCLPESGVSDELAKVVRGAAGQLVSRPRNCHAVTGGEEPTTSESTQLPVSDRPQQIAAPPPSDIKVERLERLSDDDMKVVVSVTLDRAAARALVECSIFDNSGGLIRIITIPLLNLTAGRKTETNRVAYKVVGAKLATCRLGVLAFLVSSYCLEREVPVM